MITTCLTFDFDAMSVWLGSAKSSNPSMISRGEFGAIGVERILNLLSKKQITATFCVPGHTALAFPDLVRRIACEGHEICHHGWIHENPADFDEQGERTILDKGLEALYKVAGVTPVGYRSPAWDFSERTVSLLLEYGFEYDSSLMGNDFSAYYVREGDQFSNNAPYIFGKTVPLVELPVNWSLDDFPNFEFVFGAMQSMKTPRELEGYWRDEFDWAAQNVPDGIFTLTFHPQVVGRGSRMAMLERLIDHMNGACTFSTMMDYARTWKARNSLPIA